MKESFIYLQIAESIRHDILQGKLKAGDRMPSVRQLASQWDCTLGTVQHAYQELSRQGLITSRPGQGTRIANVINLQEDTPLRRANLVHRAETFLLEVLTGGYSLSEVDLAMRMALDRWRAVEHAPIQKSSHAFRFSGSHDLAINWIASHFPDHFPQYHFQISFTGSLGGLIALQEGKADIVGSHLWDKELDVYNIPFIKRLFPGQSMALITLAYRRLGLILPPGNPSQLKNLHDLIRPDVWFINRQAGSGTRVWLDAQLRSLEIDTQLITGYENVKLTHTDVAQAIAEGQANAGIGLETAALAYRLNFIHLTNERYDLVTTKQNLETPAYNSLASWLRQPNTKMAITNLGGYLTSHTGEIEIVT